MLHNHCVQSKRGAGDSGSGDSGSGDSGTGDSGTGAQVKLLFMAVQPSLGYQTSH